MLWLGRALLPGFLAVQIAAGQAIAQDNPGAQKTEEQTGDPGKTPSTPPTGGSPSTTKHVTKKAKKQPSQAKNKVDDKDKSHPATAAKPTPTNAPQGSLKIETPTLPEKPQPATEAQKKLDGNLLRVAQAHETQGDQSADLVAKSLFELDAKQRIKVDIALTDKSKIPAFKETLQGQGAEIITDLENHVFALISPRSITQLAGQSEVFSIASVSATIRK